jgi:hypothetical protein
MSGLLTRVVQSGSRLSIVLLTFPVKGVSDGKNTERGTGSLP